MISSQRLLAKNLKDNEEYGQVFIVPDRSREERIEHRKLVEQLQLKLILGLKIQRKGAIFGKKLSTKRTADIVFFDAWF